MDPRAIRLGSPAMLAKPSWVAAFGVGETSSTFSLFCAMLVVGEERTTTVHQLMQSGNARGESKADERTSRAHLRMLRVREGIGSMACIGEKTGSMVIDKITAVVFVVVVRFFVESKVVGHLFPKEVSPVRRRRFAVFFVLGEKMWSKPFLNFAPVFFNSEERPRSLVVVVAPPRRQLSSSEKTRARRGGEPRGRSSFVIRQPPCPARGQPQHLRLLTPPPSPSYHH